MRRIFLTLCLVGAAGFAFATVQEEAQEEACDMTGEIVKLDRESKTLEVKEPGEEGEVEQFQVDESSVPGWYTNFSVGDVAAVTCKYREEQAPVVVGLKKVRAKDEK